MSAEERNGGGSSSGKTKCFTTSEGFITYKRRKRTLGSGIDLQGDPSVSSAGQKAMEVPRDKVICNGVLELGGLARIEHHRRNVLEHILQLPDVRDDNGIWNCILKALTSGPFGFASCLNMHTAQTKDTHVGHGGLQCEAQRENNSLYTAKKHKEVTSNGLQKETSDPADVHVITKKCQNALLEVLVSEKFALLCDFLSRNFPGIKANSVVDFSLINSRMKSGFYGQSLGLFHQDMQQVWEKIKMIGQEMALLASSLSNISQASYQRKVGEDLGTGAGEQKYQRINQAGAEEKNSLDSYTTTQFPCESDRSTKPEQTEASCLYKVSTCKKCGAEAYGKCSLICDGCEAAYHFSCIKPAVQEIPTRSWYCDVCTMNNRESTEPSLTNSRQDGQHQNCVVCDRLNALGMQEHLIKGGGENATASDSRESSVSSMESDESPQPSRTAMSRLCKKCGTCEDDNKKFLICGNSLCLYKYYHIRCLKSTQIASLQQRHQSCWYCPSCLCRACLFDRDDDKIVMCDGCDEAYHTYCMKPPRTSVPKGKWYCVPCNILRAKQGMRRYEQWILQQHMKDDVRLANGGNGSVDILAMDILASVVEKNSDSEEK